jgi:hypothetical protein
MTFGGKEASHESKVQDSSTARCVFDYSFANLDG